MPGSRVEFAHGLANFHEKAENVMPWVTAGGAGVSIADYNNDGRKFLRSAGMYGKW